MDMTETDNAEFQSFLQQYYQAAEGWNEDRVSNAQRSERKAWWTAAGFGGLAGVACIAVLVLTPLKRVENHVWIADKATGTLEEITRLDEQSLSLPEVFNRKFINDFMLARETYTYETAEPNYYTAAAFMAPDMQGQWARYYHPDNPDSPINIYKNHTKVRADIRSIVINTKGDNRQDVATIRFTKTIQKGELKQASNWVATVSFKYVNAPTDEKIRRINPVGFIVTDYRTDPEIGGTTTPIRSAPPSNADSAPAPFPDAAGNPNRSATPSTSAPGVPSPVPASRPGTLIGPNGKPIMAPPPNATPEQISDMAKQLGIPASTPKGNQ